MRPLTSLQRRALHLAATSRAVLGEPEALDTPTLSPAWTERALNKAETRDPRAHAKALRKSMRNLSRGTR